MHRSLDDDSRTAPDSVRRKPAVTHPLVFDVPAELAGHLGTALGVHLNWLTRTEQGRSVAPQPGVLHALQAMRQLFADRATAGQDGTPLRDLWTVRHAPAMAPKLLSLDDTATALGCSERTVKRLIADGVLPAVKLLGATRVRVQDLDTYIAGLPATKGCAA
ncbi:helix-turn-helix domain-containing protein [Blastococcus xanthinilyticus]|uniref:Excisionase family DNA binding protein n=1 Tax=Blastococcus xanthinilyticus TaxID=1564164 RepID=A0A5S5CXI8_9ACTN|nr:helix-turn-helix domain-containing protein [Blastococcus xanthinilyticus]TYP88433.1 excisionase family DNA binding protein [Blastococcus xanthinilyticus]